MMENMKLLESHNFLYVKKLIEIVHQNIDSKDPYGIENLSVALVDLTNFVEL